MNTFQTLLALLVLIYVLSVIVQAVQEIAKSVFGAKAKTILIGGFALLAVFQCAADAPLQIATKKTVEQRPVTKAPVPTPAGGAARGPAKSANSDAAGAETPALTRLENALLDAVDSDYASMSLRDCLPTKNDPSKIVCDGKAIEVKVSDAGLRAKLKQFHVGDHIRVDIEGDKLTDLLGPWSVPAEGVSASRRLLVLAACGLAILALATAAAKAAPREFIIGLDKRYSNSKFQMALWFWIAISTYLATVVFRLWYAGWDFFGGVNIPQNLLLLSGMSVITYGGAKAITTAKVESEKEKAEAEKQAAVRSGTHSAAIHSADPKPDAHEAKFFQDLVQNDKGSFDFGDFQMLVVTFIAVGMYLMLIFHYLGTVEFLKTASLPDVDTTILASFGLGQGAYLVKKAAGEVGKT
jgi:threonine/homoserine/homoserine lactone efflux protein